MLVAPSNGVTLVTLGVVPVAGVVPAAAISKRSKLTVTGAKLFFAKAMIPARPLELKNAVFEAPLSGGVPGRATKPPDPFSRYEAFTVPLDGLPARRSSTVPALPRP